MKIYRDYPPPSHRMGLLWTLTSVKDLVILEFGPEGTTRVLLESLKHFNYEPRSRPFTTRMDEEVVILGDNTRLIEAVRELDQRYSPSHIVILDSSVAAVIGIDLEGLCRECQKDVEAELIPVTGGGLSGDWTKGVEHGLTLLAGLAEDQHAQTEAFNILGLCADEFNQVTEMQSIIQLIQNVFHVDIPCVLSVDASIDQCRGLGNACMNIVLRREALPAARLLETRFGTPFLYQRPYGLEGTRNWIRQISQLSGLEADCSFLDNHCEQIHSQISQVRTKYQKKGGGKALIGGHIDTVTGLQQFLKEELEFDASEPDQGSKQETVLEDVHERFPSDADLVFGNGLVIRQPGDFLRIQTGYPLLEETRSSQPALMGLTGASYIAGMLNNNKEN